VPCISLKIIFTPKGFYINLPIAAFVFPILLIINIPERSKADDKDRITVRTSISKLDLWGFFLFASLAVQFLLALQWGGTKYPWKSATIIGLFCGSAGTFIIFLIQEFYAGENAMVPFSIVKKTVVWSSCLVCLFFFGALITWTYYLPIYFQAVKGVSPTLSGVYVLPGVLSQIAMAIISGVLGRHHLHSATLYRF
jgi:MFS family permease